nr:hypothetical protein [Tanacetum cinerariifolium]
MDKQLEDQSTPKKRRRHDQDQDPSADGTVHDVEMKIRESVEDDVVDVEDPTQADEPTVDDAPEQTWFNEMVNAEKNQWTFDVVMGLIIDFTNFTKNCLKKNKITKVNLKGDRIPHDYRKPLPLHGAPGHLTIPVDFFFNKDLEYLTTRNVEKKYATSWIKPKAARVRQAVQSNHKAYSQMKILIIIRMSTDKQFRYGYLKEIIVIHANQKEYTIKEADFPRHYLNDIEDMYLLYAQNKIHHLTCNEETDLVTALWFFIQ